MQNRQLTLIIFVLLCCTIGISQTNFQKGYYIKSSGERVECLIKNSDWLDSPNSLKYKLSDKGQIIELTIDNLNAFGVYTGQHFVKQTINFDTSPVSTNNLSDKRNPIFEERTVFLEKLIEGEASLTRYVTGNYRRFYLKIGSNNYEPLVQKEYRDASADILENNYFRQQLLTQLACDDISDNMLERLQYKEKALMDLLKKYNNCLGKESVVYEKVRPKSKENLLRLDALVGARFNTLNVVRFNTEVGTSLVGVQLGVGGEYFLNFNNNKWSVIGDVTYYSFSEELNVPITVASTATTTNEIEYSALELTLGGRHSFYLNESSRLFLDLGISFSQPLTDTYTVTSNRSFETLRKSLVLLGVGFAHNEWSLRGRYVPKRDFIDGIESDYSAFALLLGYSFL